MSLEQPKFNEIFASGAGTGEILDWPSTSYIRGWGYLSIDEPPTMEFFNKLQNANDKKAQYLFESMNIRKNTTLYNQDDIVYSPNLPKKGTALLCVTGGITGSIEPDFSGVNIGDTVTDGTVTWQIAASDYNIKLASDTDMEEIITEVFE